MTKKSEIQDTFKKDLALHDFQINMTKKNLLGRGAFSHVFVCVKDKKKCAAKISSNGWGWIENKPEDTSVITEHHTRELQIMVSLDPHPNLVKMLDTFYSRRMLEINKQSVSINSFYLILEYADMGSLFQWIRDTWRPEESIIKFLARDLINAVRYMHSKNIVHGDIKPMNCLLFTNQSSECKMQLKLCDFNLSSTTLETKNPVGTHVIRAPENLRNGYFAGKGYPSLMKTIQLKPADWWSVGATIFYAFHRRYPLLNREERREGIMRKIFKNKRGALRDPSKMYETVRRLQLPFDKSLSKPCVDVIQKLLEPNPADRNLDDQLVETWINSRTPPRTLSLLKNRMNSLVEEILGTTKPIDIKTKVTEFKKEISEDIKKDPLGDAIQDLHYYPIEMVKSGKINHPRASSRNENSIQSDSSGLIFSMEKSTLRNESSTPNQIYFSQSSNDSLACANKNLPEPVQNTTMEPEIEIEDIEDVESTNQEESRTKCPNCCSKCLIL